MDVWQLEPIVAQALNNAICREAGEVPDAVMLNYINLSQAVSLRRIADTLGFIEQNLRQRP